jgi:hypothetical protein
MPLTPDQKTALRAFRDASQAALNARSLLDPPGMTALVLHRVVRHECAAEGGASVGITLREVREESPEYWVCYCGIVTTWSPHFPHRDCDGAKVVAAAGEFAWLWKEGRCSGCGLAVRTAKGRYVVSADHPARERRQAGPHHHDPRLPGA